MPDRVGFFAASESRRQPWFARVLALALSPLLAACVVGEDGDFDSLSGGTGGSGGAGSTETGDEPEFPPNAVACNFELGANPLSQQACVVDGDCCSGFTASADVACPGDIYPNNWTCDSGVCRQGSPQTEGCSNDDECMFPGFECVAVLGVGHCVGPCATDDDCGTEHNMPHSTCETGGGASFCMQVTP